MVVLLGRATGDGTLDIVASVANDAHSRRGRSKLPRNNSKQP